MDTEYLYYFLVETASGKIVDAFCVLKEKDLPALRETFSYHEVDQGTYELWLRRCRPTPKPVDKLEKLYAQSLYTALMSDTILDSIEEEE